MIKDAIRYTVIILIVIGIVLVMKNLIKNDDVKFKKKSDSSFYSASVYLYEDGTDKLLSGADMVVKNSDGKEIASFTTTDKSYAIDNLKVGSYTLEEISAPDGYDLYNDRIVFTIKNKNVDVKMYNTVMSDEDLEKEKVENTNSNEIGVENTGSNYSKIIYLISIVFFIVGSFIISNVMVKNKY